MKKIILVCTLFLSVCFFNTAKASHLMGGEITYVNIGNDSLEITVTIYRDCNGILISNSPLQVEFDSIIQSYNLQFISKRDITGVGANCIQQSRCTGSYQYGIEEHIYKTRIKLSPSNGCIYTFSWQQCCRNGNISTGPANRNFYIQTTYNKCLAPNNSSPSFLSSPIIFLSLGDDVSVSHSAIDTIDNDYFSYELINPYDAPGAQIPYSGQFSSEKPLSFLGFPNANLSSPAGFRFDTLTSNMTFRPTLKDQSTVVTVKVKEWRIVGGVPQVISETIRDLQLIVISSAGNKLPKINSNKVNGIINSCGIGNYCVTIPVEDADASDTIKVEVKHNFTNLTVNQTVIQSNKINVEICFTVDSALLNSNSSYFFKIVATDNHCPQEGKSEKTYVYRHDSAVVITLPKIPPICETSTPILLFSTPNYGTWSGSGVSGTAFTPSVAGAGWHYLYYDFTDSVSNCHSYDSISVRVVQQPKASFTANAHTGLYIDTFKFTNTTTADTVYTSSWNMGKNGVIGNIQNTSNASVVYNDTGRFIVSLVVSNFNICPKDTATDTVVVSYPLAIKTVKNSTLKLYPNPARDKIFIEADNELTEITVVDVLGRRYTAESILGDATAEINISAIPAGIYMIEAKDISGKVYTSKVQIIK